MKKAELLHRGRELELYLQEAIHNSRSKTVVTCMPETRKIKTFCGLPNSTSGVSIADWIDDLEIAFSAREYTDSQK